MIDVTTDGAVTTITMDDGKANALSPDMQSAIHDGLDRAVDAGTAVVIAGRDGRFSGGFDLGVMGDGGDAAVGMVIGGFELARRLLTFERPVVIACTGHAMAMGAFLLLSADLRVGPTGPFKVAANEVAIGMTVPYTAIELMRARLTPAAIQRSALLAEVFDPAGAVEAGYLDRLTEPGDVIAAAQASAAGAATSLDAAAHRRTKQRLRAPTVEAIDAALARDRAELETIFSTT